MFAWSLLYDQIYKMINKAWKSLFGGCIYNLDSPNVGVSCMQSTRLRLSEDDEDASKHVGIFTIYKILLINICCAFVGLGNELYKMNGTYIKTE